MHKSWYVSQIKPWLYGLKQTINNGMKSLLNLSIPGAIFTLSITISCSIKNDTSSILLAIYVDDVLIVGTNIYKTTALKQFLHENFKIKEFRKLHYF